MKHRICALTTLSLAALSACSSAPDREAPSGAIEEGIINGAGVSTFEIIDKGLLRLDSGCSGVLLRNDWAITAGHCIDGKLSGGVGATMADQQRQSDALYKLGQFSGDANPALITPDVALIHFATPFSIRGSTTSFSTNIYDQWPRKGDALTLYGQGPNGYVPGGGTSGFGTIRTATVTSNPGQDAHGNATLDFDANASGQVIAPGDSGGPGFMTKPGDFAPMLAGISSGASWDCADRSTPDRCKATITKITSGFQMSLVPIREWITSVMSMTWDPARLVQWQDLRQAEVSGTRSVFSDVNTVAWALARRAMDHACFSRRYVSGFSNGEQASDRFGTICVGGTSHWEDVSFNEIASDVERFPSVDNVGWAQAARVAERLCANRGYAHGFWTGQYTADRAGLVCQRDDLRQYDVPRAELEGYAGEPIAHDVNAIPWALGARGAGRYCRAQGFDGGYLTGFQGDNEVMGAVCLLGEARRSRDAERWSGYFCVSGEECRVGDVNGDGRADAIAFNHGTNAGTAAWVGLSSGSQLSTPQSWSGYFCTAGEVCEVADVNGDGKADAIAFNHGTNGGTAAWVALSDGVKFGAPSVWSNYFCVGQEVCKAADVNGDGRADLVAFNHGSPGTQVWVALSDGVRFGAPRPWSDYFCVAGETCDVADVNGDGRADVVVATQGAQHEIYVGLSNGSGFGAPQRWSDYFCVQGEVCAFADMDGDRRADVIAFNHGSNGSGMWVGLSDGTRFAPGTKWNDWICVAGETCAVADTTGDHRADAIAFQRSPANGAYVAVTVR